MIPHKTSAGEAEMFREIITTFFVSIHIDLLPHRLILAYDNVHGYSRSHRQYVIPPPSSFSPCSSAKESNLASGYHPREAR